MDSDDSPERHSILLRKIAGANTRSAELGFEDAFWSFTFYQGPTALAETPLLPHPAGPRAVLLYSGVALNDLIIEALKKDELQVDVTDALKKMNRAVFPNEHEYLKALEKVLSADQVTQYEERILKAVRMGSPTMPADPGSGGPRTPHSGFLLPS